MSKLICDYTQVEISSKVKDILHMYHSSSWHSEPYHQSQNPSEWRYRTIKAWINTILSSTGATAKCWLLGMGYVCYLLNHISLVFEGRDSPQKPLWCYTRSQYHHVAYLLPISLLCITQPILSIH